MSELKEYLQELNKQAESNGSPFRIVEDLKHWERYNISTVNEFIRYNNEQEIWDLYKEVHGIRPRHIKFKNMNDEEIKKMAEDLNATITKQIEAAEAEEEKHKMKYKLATTCEDLTQPLEIPNF